MARHLNKGEIQKRIAIKLAKARDPAIGYRTLARMHATSLRVVCDAMTRSVAEWRDVLVGLEPEGRVTPTVPSTITTPRARVESTTKARESGFDPERDLDVDELANFGDE